VTAVEKAVSIDSTELASTTVGLNVATPDEFDALTVMVYVPDAAGDGVPLMVARPWDPFVKASSLGSVSACL
jgi:hypothetical protein